MRFARNNRNEMWEIHPNPFIWRRPERWTANTFSFVTFHNNHNFSLSFFFLPLFSVSNAEMQCKKWSSQSLGRQKIWRWKKRIHRCCRIKRIFDKYLISTVALQPLDVTKSESLIDSNLNTNSFSDDITTFPIWIRIRLLWIRSDVWLCRFNSNKSKQWTINWVGSESPWHTFMFCNYFPSPKMKNKKGRKMAAKCVLIVSV